MSEKSNFLIRRVHSLLGIIPVGIFLCVHFLINSSVFLNGFSTYEITIKGMKAVPLIVLAELIIIAIPILFHGIYGIWIVYLAKNNALRFTYYRNWMFYLQRITAVITLIFVIIHVYTLRLMQHEPAMIINTLVSHLQNPLFFALYIIGVLSAIFHFANGIFTFLISWGITIGEHSQNIFTKVSALVFLAMGVWGVGILMKIAAF
ncbi:MAG: succinate dehydrogenase [Desulfitobacteriaceae bacterium]|nr:succinate dehydrogenase [Desulfitobacteriaceae bacterium]MDD4753100.1 succinate dehydrogenase [Desulfitobacteriaceae bacterium]